MIFFLSIQRGRRQKQIASRHLRKETKWINFIQLYPTSFYKAALYRQKSKTYSSDDNKMWPWLVHTFLASFWIPYQLFQGTWFLFFVEWLSNAAFLKAWQSFSHFLENSSQFWKVTGKIGSSQLSLSSFLAEFTTIRRLRNKKYHVKNMSVSTNSKH